MEEDTRPSLHRREESPDHMEQRDGKTAMASSLNDTLVQDDGRININMASPLSRALSKIVKVSSPNSRAARASPHYRQYTSPDQFPLRLSIVIQVVGSRGDVQPSVALGNGLQKTGHRVRLATHGKFENFVHEAGLDFFPIGGDPEDLMSYMVKSPGLIPSMQSLRTGDISHKRHMIAEMLEGCWHSCIAPDPLTNEPFVADAIIANPPSFAHIHCSEALGIPLHLMFTMPWTATSSFPHPLANMSNGMKDSNLANHLSYTLVEIMTWQGLGDVINDWRKTIGLERVPSTEGPFLASTLQIPFTYCWSPALLAKPNDWPAHIDVSGFFFRRTPDYTPPEDLQAFLDAGTPPVYIGFGSIIVDNAAEMSSLILEAISACGYRAIISRGWSHLDGPERDDVYWLADCPHEWLFQHVSAVVHHGGAGTTACGLRNARPTTIIPFFGDQPFWGDMVAAAGAGPVPIPHKSLTAEKLAAALRLCHEEVTQSAAIDISDRMQMEDGVDAAILSFLNNLPTETMQCDFLPDQPSSWLLRVNNRSMKASRLAAEILIERGEIDPKNLNPYRPHSIVIENRRWDPTTGLLSSTMGVGTDIISNVSGVILKPAAEYRRHRTRKVGSTGTTTELDSSASTSTSASLTPPHSLSTASIISGEKEQVDQMSVAGSMALASGKSLGKVIPTFYRGAFVEMPLAVAEGFRNTPRLWGDTPTSYGQVLDWKSGGLVAGKSLALGIADGLCDLAVMPAKGAKEEGLLGGIKGLGKGGGSLLTKTVSGCVGIVAYPGQGIAKSIWASAHKEAHKRVMKSRRMEGMNAARRADKEVKERVEIVYHEAKIRGKARFGR